MSQQHTNPDHPVQHQIEVILHSQFSPVYLELLNESHMHSVPANSETHFKLTMVTEQFDGMRKVARHQRVYQALRAQLEGPVHALALHLYTTEEWQARSGNVPASPNCRGGSKNDPFFAGDENNG